MAADLSLLKVRRNGMACCNGLVLLLLCVVSPVAPAEVLTDPTKPPVEISAPPMQAGQATAPEGDRLQSIIISPTRRAAIINGQTVELGAKHGEAKLIEVNEGGVVLQGAQGRQALTLFPGVEIKRKEPPKENDVKHITQKKKPVRRASSQTGKKEEK